jgi:hypothetical protein
MLPSRTTCARARRVLFNLLVLGLGDLAAKWIFIPLQARLTHDGIVNYQQLMLAPAGLAVAAAIILLVGFKPPADLGAPRNSAL